MNDFYEERTFDGELYFRTRPGGAFRKMSQTPIDTLVDLARIYLNTKTKKETLALLGIQFATVTRIRQGVENVSPNVVLRFYDATGLSIAQIRKMLNLPKLVNAPLSGA
jgi:predicted amino acid racemase